MSHSVSIFRFVTIALVALALASGGVRAAGSCEERYGAAYAGGITAVNSGDPACGEELLRSALDDPDDEARALRELGFLRLASGAVEDSHQLFIRALQVDPSLAVPASYPPHFKRAFDKARDDAAERRRLDAIRSEMVVFRKAEQSDDLERAEAIAASIHEMRPGPEEAREIAAGIESLRERRAREREERLAETEERLAWLERNRPPALVSPETREEILDELLSGKVSECGRGLYRLDVLVDDEGRLVDHVYRLRERSGERLDPEDVDCAQELFDRMRRGLDFIAGHSRSGDVWSRETWALEATIDLAGRKVDFQPFEPDVQRGAEWFSGTPVCGDRKGRCEPGNYEVRVRVDEHGELAEVQDSIPHSSAECKVSVITKCLEDRHFFPALVGSLPREGEATFELQILSKEESPNFLGM